MCRELRSRRSRFSETNLDEVLQSRAIFINVSKGQVAKSDAVEKCFGTADADAILKEILRRGELQVGEKEREAALSKVRREIASCLANLSVNPTTMRPYPVTILEKAMKEVHYKPDAKKPAKRQALELLVLLQPTMPIERAKMRLKLSCSAATFALLEHEHISAVESRTELAQGLEAVVLIEPGSFRAVDEAVQREGGRVTVVSLAAQREGEGGESELDVIGTPLAPVTTPSGETPKADTVTAVAVGDKPTAADGNGGAPDSATNVPAKRAAKPAASRRAQRGQADMSELMGVVKDDSDDDDWKKGGKGGKRGAGKKKAGRK